MSQAEPNNAFKAILEKAILDCKADEYTVDEARKLLHSIVNARHDAYLVQMKKKPPKGQRGSQRARSGADTISSLMIADAEHQTQVAQHPTAASECPSVHQRHSPHSNQPLHIILTECASQCDCRHVKRLYELRIADATQWYV